MPNTFLSHWSDRVPYAIDIILCLPVAVLQSYFDHPLFMNEKAEVQRVQTIHPGPQISKEQNQDWTRSDPCALYSVLYRSLYEPSGQDGHSQGLRLSIQKSGFVLGIR